MSFTTPLVSPSVPRRLPPLQNGDRLNRIEFERRFDAMPDLKRAELIDGIVFMPPPVSYSSHGRPNSSLVAWLAVYSASTPGTETASDATVRLANDNVAQPDSLLLIQHACGGQANISEDDYVEGGPELVCETSASTASLDVHAKREIYRRSGVREYVVWRTYDHEVDYFILRDGEFVRLEPAQGSSQVYRSEIFPGLWLDAAALLRGDLKTVLGVLQQGIDSAEHEAFVEHLRTRDYKPG